MSKPEKVSPQLFSRVVTSKRNFKIASFYNTGEYFLN